MVISEDTFRKYLVARAEGQFNMYMEGRACAQAYGIPLVQYCYIMQNFEELRQKFAGLEQKVNEEVFRRLLGKDVKVNIIGNPNISVDPKATSVTQNYYER